jgi:hypothetical protein
MDTCAGERKKKHYTLCCFDGKQRTGELPMDLYESRLKQLKIRQRASI